MEGRPTMLVLSRKLDEEIVIDGRVVVKVVAIDRGKVRLGVEAPQGVRVNRREVEDRPRDNAARPPPQRVMLSTADGRPSLDDQLDGVQVKSGEAVTLDFGSVARIYSAGLGKVVGLHRRVAAGGGDLLFCNLNPLVREAFAVAWLDGFLGLSP
jgi:carbon storage regulator